MNEVDKWLLVENDTECGPVAIDMLSGVRTVGYSVVEGVGNHADFFGSCACVLVGLIGNEGTCSFVGVGM